MPEHTPSRPAHERPERLTMAYLDFDSYFASVEQQRRPELRGRPVGITPSDLQMGGTIAVSREAKAAGVSRVGSRRDALAICPDMAFVAQDPVHYIEVHKQALRAIETVVPVHEVRGIDELSIRLTASEAREPEWIAARINGALAEAIGKHITASIGFSTNRVLAKMASAADKPCGVTVWRPQDMPGPILERPFAAVPGIGERMARRLARNGISSIPELLAIPPKRARAIWGSVVGERMWYALQGFDIEDPDTRISMIGHGRVLPRSWQGLQQPYGVARYLTVKAARRMRRAGLCAGRFYLGVKLRDPGNDRNVYTRDAHARARFHRWSTEVAMTFEADDHACLTALGHAWAKLSAMMGTQAETQADARADAPNIAHVQVALTSLVPASARQADLFADARPNADKWRRISEIADSFILSERHAPLWPGNCLEPPGGNAGTKIAFGRVPDPEDAAA